MQAVHAKWEIISATVLEPPGAAVAYSIPCSAALLLDAGGHGAETRDLPLSLRGQTALSGSVRFEASGPHKASAQSSAKWRNCQSPNFTSACNGKRAKRAGGGGGAMGTRHARLRRTPVHHEQGYPGHAGHGRSSALKHCCSRHVHGPNTHPVSVFTRFYTCYRRHRGSTLGFEGVLECLRPGAIAAYYHTQQDSTGQMANRERGVNALQTLSSTQTRSGRL